MRIAAIICEYNPFHQGHRYQIEEVRRCLGEETGVLCLTAVAPHSLNIRPVVVSDEAVITLSVESRSHNFLIAVDGRSAKCGEHTRLTIRKAPYKISVVKRSGHTYYTTLREKMMWGADGRV